MKEKKICKIEGCGSICYCKGYCNKHYHRYLRNGDPLLLKNEKHQLSKTSEYITWRNMRRRCNLVGSPSYERYGGRGISVCEEWENSFITFYSDMGEKPFKKAQIDRINNDGNYEPDNCRWVDPLTNVRNRSTIKMNKEKAIKIRDLYKSNLFTLKELGLIYKVSLPCIWDIVKNKTWKTTRA